MEYQPYTDVGLFMEKASPLLLAHEAHNNLLFGLSADVRHNPATYSDMPVVLRAVEDDGAVVLAALQTPPYRLVLSHTDRLAATALLASALFAEGHRLPGVAGPRPVAEAFAQNWAAHAGVRVEVGMNQRIYQLTAVRHPEAVSGHFRLASEADRPLLEDWLAAFQREAESEAQPRNVGAAVTRWLTGPGRSIGLWEHGEPVSMAGTAGPTPHGIRIGAVYTPPAQRRKGYASALVAALSQGQLDAGRRFCFLFTDLANPTSNHIYQAIGYEPVVDMVDLRFVER
jgi:predicted GNAT family acetyltransferase